MSFYFDYTTHVNQAVGLDAIIELKLKASARKKELQLRDMARNWINSGYDIRELRAYQMQSSGCFVSVRPDAKVSRFRLWIRRRLMWLRIRPTAGDLYRQLDERAEGLGAKIG